VFYSASFKGKWGGGKTIEIFIERNKETREFQKKQNKSSLFKERHRRPNSYLNCIVSKIEERDRKR
jgi:hypothetical protein